MARSDREAADIARQAEFKIRHAAQLAFEELLRRIAAGDDVARAIEEVQQAFSGGAVEAMQAAFSDLLRRSVGMAEVRALPVSGVALSEHLYRHNAQTALEVAALVREHAQGLTQARELAMRLYDGYHPGDGRVRPLEGRARADLPKALRALTQHVPTRKDLASLIEQGQQQAGRLRSRALRAGYSEALDAWAKGKGAAALANRLEVAQREKNRYMANRIAQTELARAHQAQVAADLLADETIDVVQVLLNGAHPKRDICDMHARADLFGLGPGCYPKRRAPRPPFHPHCWCKLRSRPDLSAEGAREVPGGEAAYLRGLPPGEAGEVMGSRAKAEAVAAGASVEAVVNAGRDPMYRLQRVGDPGAGHPLVRSAIASQPQIAAFLNSGAPGAIPVALVPRDIQVALGATADVVLLSRYTADKQRKHPEITAESFSWLQELLDQGSRLYDTKHHATVIQHREQPYLAVLKSTSDGSEVYLQSFRRTDAKNIASLRKRSGDG